MVVMIVVLVVCALALGAAVAAGAARRHRAGERHSVRDYQQTIDTLRHLGDRRMGQRPASTRPAEPPVRRPVTPSTVLAASAGPKTVSARVAPPHPGGTAFDHTELHMSDVTELTADPTTQQSPGDIDRGGQPGSGVAAPSAAVRELASGRVLFAARPARSATAFGHERPMRGPTRSRHGAALSTTSRPSVVLVAAAVIALGAVVAVAVAAGSGHGAGTTAQSRTRPTAPATRPASSGSAPSELTAVSSSAASATYQVAGSPVTVEVMASGPCWIDATDVVSGKVLWTGTMVAGQSQSLTATTGLVVRMGAVTNISMSVAGRPVRLPAGSHSPFDARFQTA
ncbi:MAG TPA: RodZ domain-containing protein [Acidimicrobiales bacterium]|nr:RodZ domain-containing protein [Acidimicrobiales bacterium]